MPATGAAPTAIPLVAAHTPGGTDGVVSVSLAKISGLQNVGQLPNDQEIVFGPTPGLTVIYGENGSGKSGYARVIKNACRARGATQDIKPDAFDPNATGPARAMFACRVGAVDTPVDWTDGSVTDPRLSNIFVFDSFSARSHVSEDGPACFKPRGLDVLPELAKACDTIKAELQEDIDAEFNQITVVRSTWNRTGSTTVGKIVNALGPDTDPAKIDAAAMWTDADDRKLGELIATLSTDPKLKAADTTAAANRIRALAVTAKSRATSVDETAMQTIGEAIKDAVITAKAAKAAAGPELKDGDLPGSCNDVWRKLWDAAKVFSVADAYPGKQFPFTEAGAKCVLCQQTLQPDAIDRYARFNKFVADETRKLADVAKAKVADLKMGVDLLRAIGSEATGVKADLDRETPGTYATVEAFTKAVDARIAHAQQCLKDGTWSDAPDLPASPCDDLLTLVTTLDARASAEAATANPVKKKETEAERDELTDKRWLAGKKDEVKAQIARYAYARKLKKCQVDCTTNTITIKSGELHDSHVTAAYCKAFEDERVALGLKTLSVKLDAAKGAKGERRFGVKLNGTATAKVGDIASEGEHRCIALAAFMAELSQASHKSAVVFDDPVSSLDHKRRDAIAARLVKEASYRQVVVFTHDLAFVCDLEAAARALSMKIHTHYIERLAGKPGRVLAGLPWDAQSYKEQMKTLNDQIGRLDRVHKMEGDSEYRDNAMPVIGRIRGACERIIEQKLLNRVIQRHDSRIDVKNTPSLAAVTTEQWKAVHAIWKECSNIIEAHAPPQSSPVNVPTPDRLKTWMQELQNTVDAVKQARDPASAPTVPESKLTRVSLPYA